MSAVAVASSCVSCGREFEQAGVGRPRVHCEECRKPRLKAAPVPARRSVSGDPFTVAHFRVWAERLKLDSGARFVLEPFQEWFVADVFGGVPEAWLVVPEGNGKTTLIALLALYHIEHREDAMVPVAASAREQAGIIYRQASGFVRRNRLEHVFRCLPGFRRIECLATGGTIQVFAADASVNDGVIFTLAIIDELHRHKSLDLQRTWSGKLDKRDAQLVVISTAGEPGGPFESERQSIRQGATAVQREECFVRAASETTVLHEWAVPEDGDVENLGLVARANPLATVTEETLRLKRMRIRHLGHWKRFTCNLPTRGDAAAITETEWFAAMTEERIPVGEPVWVGLDLGWKHDTTAIVPLWMRDPEFRLLGVPTILTPPRDSTMMDPAEVEEALLAIHARNPIAVVVMDMTGGAQLSEWMRLELGCEVVDRTQTNAFAVMDYARFTEALRYGWLKHCGDAGLTRHVLNAIAKQLPGGDLRFDRPKAGRRSSEQDSRVIDALTAAAMVHTSLSAELVGGPEAWVGW